jgi:hypothetical protein
MLQSLDSNGVVKYATGSNDIVNTELRPAEAPVHIYTLYSSKWSTVEVNSESKYFRSYSFSNKIKTVVREHRMSRKQISLYAHNMRSAQEINIDQNILKS